jgi:hypothetical protein
MIYVYYSSKSKEIFNVNVTNITVVCSYKSNQMVYLWMLKKQSTKMLKISDKELKCYKILYYK